MAEPITPTQLVEALRADRRQRWQQGDRVLAEQYFQLYPTLQADPDRAVELVYHEVLLREELGETPHLDEYLRRFPQWTDRLKPLFEVHRALEDGRLFSDPRPKTLRGDAAPSGEGDESEPLPSVPGYEVLERLGRGGMGVVYRARHQALNRLVALKMIRAGAQAEPAGRARLRAEAEAQARLQHPNIVPIYEVGEVDGCPYLALEYVGGGTLAQKLAGMPQPAWPAAQLVETLARAIHQAHQHGLVHRDLKPANVLLTTDGTPKISDFGLVKHLDKGEGQTRSGEILGTPSYMAPEQARDHPAPVEPAADIYALGVILYEMLTGRPPFLAESALATLVQVRSLDPVPPRRLQPHVPRDLETICLKCLQKQPARRYAHAESLAEDLRRFQAGEPIRARPVGLMERGSKWTRRRPTAAALAALGMLLLLGGAAAGLWYADHERDRAERETALRQHAERAEQEAKDQETLARQESDKAKRSETEARAVMTFFQERVLAAARPTGLEGGLGKDATIWAALDAAEPRIAQTFADQPAVEAAIRHSLGQTYYYLGLPDRAIHQHDLALAIRQRIRSPNDAEILTSMNELATAYLAAGRLAEALALFEDVLKRRQAELGIDHPDTLVTLINLGATYNAMGRSAEAVPMLKEAIQGLRARNGDDSSILLIAMNNLAGMYVEGGRPGDALPLLEEILGKQKATFGVDHADTLTTANNLGAAYRSVGRLTDAVNLYQEVLRRRQAQLPPDHPETLISMNNLASTYLVASRVDEAVTLHEDTLRRLRAKLGPDHVRTLESMNNLAHAYSAAGRVTDAVPLCEQALKGRQAQLGPDHPDTLTSLSNLAFAYRKAGRLDEAVSLHEEALKRQLARFGPDHARTPTFTGFLIQGYLAAQQSERALALVNDFLAAQRRKLGSDNPRLAHLLALVGKDLLTYGCAEEAETVLREALSIRETKLPDDWTTFNAKSQLGGSLLGQQKYSEAEPLLVQGYEGLRAREKAIPPQEKVRLSEVLDRLVELYDTWGKTEQADYWRKQRQAEVNLAPLAK